MSEYVLKSELKAEVQRIIAEAQHPAEEISAEYPCMVYHHGSRSDVRLVHDIGEESTALEAGYRRTPGPQYPSGYPQDWIERGPDRGGTKVWDHRRVTLYNAAEKKLFEAVVDIADWVLDDHQHGGRGVGLDALSEEYREMRRQLISREPLVEADPPATEAAAPVETAEGEQS